MGLPGAVSKKPHIAFRGLDDKNLPERDLGEPRGHVAGERQTCHADRVLNREFYWDKGNGGRERRERQRPASLFKRTAGKRQWEWVELVS